jgi:hypothetical protein
LRKPASLHHHVHFHIRLDAAGQYADNLLGFLQQLSHSRTDDPALANAVFTLSCGDPQRNKNYCAALYGPKKRIPSKLAPPPVNRNPVLSDCSARDGGQDVPQRRAARP